MERPKSSRSLGDLTQETRQKVNDALDICEVQHVDMLVYCTHRPLLNQAYWYRWSRRSADIKAKIRELNAAGYYQCANALDEIGPVMGTLGIHRTNAAPGESWHQYGEAVDAVPLVMGKCMWDDREGYMIFADACDQVGLEWAGTWQRFKEWPHAQRAGLERNPLQAFGPDAIEAALNYNSIPVIT